MRRVLLGIVAIALASAGACSRSSSEPPERVKLIEAHVNVFGWDGRVGAMLIDRGGRRTGWKVDGSVRDIAGCTLQSGSEVGIPDEIARDSLEEPTSVDTVPMYHYFRIHNDAVTPVGLIDQGGCELRLDPIVAGKVHLALGASGIGLNGCGDTTSVWVKPGVPSRWRLSWKPAGEKCVVKLSKMDASPSAKRGGR
jgi:hypothetical protein